VYAPRLASGGRKWLNVPEEFAGSVREHLVREGGIDAGEMVGPPEARRVKFSDVP
jgi:hypothetical protein